MSSLDEALAHAEGAQAMEQVAVAELESIVGELTQAKNAFSAGPTEDTYADYLATLHRAKGAGQVIDAIVNHMEKLTKSIRETGKL